MVLYCFRMCDVQQVCAPKTPKSYPSMQRNPFRQEFFFKLFPLPIVRTAMQGAGGPARSQYPLRPSISQVLADEIFHPKAQRGKTCIANGFLEGMVPIRF